MPKQDSLFGPAVQISSPLEGPFAVMQAPLTIMHYRSGLGILRFASPGGAH